MTTPDGGAGSTTATDPVTDAKGRRGAKTKKDSTGSTGSGEVPNAGDTSADGQPKAEADKPAEPKTEGGQRRAAAKPNLRDLVGAPGGAWAPKGEAPVKGLVRAQWDAGQHWLGEGGKWAAKAMPIGGSLVRVGAKALPLIGSLYALSEAAKDLKHGDYVGAGLDIIGVVPGPIGWAGLLASHLWDNVFHHGGTGSLWEAPDGVKVYMLPASAADNGGVAEADEAITDKQKAIFGFQDGPTGTVWGSNPPESLRLDTAEVKTALSGWLTGVANHFAAIEQTLANANEPYMNQWREKLAPHFDTMRKLPNHAKAITAELEHASNGAAGWYEALTKANRAARMQLADHGTLSNGAAAHALEESEKTSKLVIGNAVKKLGQVAGTGDGPKALAPPTRVMPAHTNIAQPKAEAPAPAAPWAPAPLGGVPMPAPTAPAPATPAPAAPAPKAPEDALAKLLASLGHTPPAPAMGGGMPSMPMGGMPGTGMGNPMGTGLGGASPKPAPAAEPVAAKRPLATERPKLNTDPVENKTVKPDAAKPAAAEAKKPDTEKTDGTAPAPAAAGVAPVPAGATPPPAPPGDHGPAVKPASMKPPVDTTVDVKGSKVQFPDAKTAALARELAAGGPGHPVSLADAATRAGLQPPVPGQDPGQQVAPHDAKPGDILRAGDKDYLLLDKGRFLDFTSGKIVGAEKMPADLGANGGYFHLRDAMTIDPATGTPVSGPAPVVTTTAVADHPTVPADATPAAATPAAPVVGTPGVPAKGAPGQDLLTLRPPTPAAEHRPHRRWPPSRWTQLRSSRRNEP